MFSTPDEQIARWNRKPGPRVGDWYETRECTLYRIGGIRNGNIRLASPSGRFALGPDGVTYSLIRGCSLIIQPFQYQRW
jgi:hypothetical protein